MSVSRLETYKELKIGVPYPQISNVFCGVLDTSSTQCLIETLEDWGAPLCNILRKKDKASRWRPSHQMHRVHAGDLRAGHKHNKREVSLAEQRDKILSVSIRFWVALGGSDSDSRAFERAQCCQKRRPLLISEVPACLLLPKFPYTLEAAVKFFNHRLRIKLVLGEAVEQIDQL